MLLLFLNYFLYVDCKIFAVFCRTILSLFKHMDYFSISDVLPVKDNPEGFSTVLVKSSYICEL